MVELFDAYGVSFVAVSRAGSTLYRLRVSARLKKDFDNGQQYYQRQNSIIWTPSRIEDKPNTQFLEWHADSAFSDESQ